MSVMGFPRMEEGRHPPRQICPTVLCQKDSWGWEDIYTAVSSSEMCFFTVLIF